MDKHDIEQIDLRNMKKICSLLHEERRLNRHGLEYPVLLEMLATAEKIYHNMKG